MGGRFGRRSFLKPALPEEYSRQAPGQRQAFRRRRQRQLREKIEFQIIRKIEVMHRRQLPGKAAATAGRVLGGAHQICQVNAIPQPGRSPAATGTHKRYATEGERAQAGMGIGTAHVWAHTASTGGNKPEPRLPARAAPGGDAPSPPPAPES